MTSRRQYKSLHLAPLLILIGLCLAYWGKVLFTGQVLLPGAMLRGFAPFGSDPNAPWNILQWDALAQYYPWRTFAARQLQAGLIPLWNPHQFAGAPFLANLQSAIFYPLNLPFWIFDTAYAFGISAALHTLLASISTYFLAQRWKLSRAASLLAAIAFGFGGYLSAWVMLPTLANTASWLSLLLLLLERAVNFEPPRYQEHQKKKFTLSPCHLVTLSLALACALLAGHAQIFFYLLVALALRALFLPQRMKAFGALISALALCALLGAAQVLPTLELARLGHRAAGGGPTLEAWTKFIQPRALQFNDWWSLFIPNWPQISFSENFGYVGIGVIALSFIAVIAVLKRPSIFNLQSSIFATTLAAFGLLYALATPLAQFFYFTVPGLSQMGGVGRALILWSFGAAMLAAFGLDALRRKWSTPIIPAVVLFLVTGELLFAGWNLHPIAPRATIYPPTTLTTWLQSATRGGSRVLFVTPRATWLPPEVLQEQLERARHPFGVLPPNGAMVYGLNDVNGYDSLAPLKYRQFVAQGEGRDVAPLFNGNMILLENVNSSALDALNVRYVVMQTPLDIPHARQVLVTDGCFVYRRTVAVVKRLDGRDFYPGWRTGFTQPNPNSETFRFGLFLSLCALGFVTFIGSYQWRQKW